MNCHMNHDNDGNQQNHNGKNHIWHILMMVLCCGLPILLLSILSIVKFSNPSIEQGLLNIVPYLCPIMMIAMIPMMFMGKNNKNSGNCCDHKEDKHL